MGITIKTSGAQVIQPSTPGHADGTVRILLDVGRVANTDTVAAALAALPQIAHPANVFGELAVISSVLAAITQHGGGAS